MGLRLLLELLLPILCDLSKSLTDNSMSRCSFITFKTILSVFSCSCSSTPCTSRQFLREYCSLSSDFFSSKNIDKVLKEYYTNEAQKASKEIEKINKMINDNLDMSSEKSKIINKLIELHSLIQIHYLNKIDNNLKANKNIDNISIESKIRELEKRLGGLPKKGSGVFTSQKEFVKLLTFLAQ